MEDFRHKAWHGAEDHMTKASATITYTSIVLRKTVRIALMNVALNDLEVKLDDILNA